VRPHIRELRPAPPAVAPVAGGTLVIDLKGVRKRRDQRPGGVEVALRNKDTGARRCIVTDPKRPVAVLGLQPGRYEASFEGRELGARGVKKASFAVAPGSRAELTLGDRRADLALTLRKASHDDGAAVVCVVILVVALAAAGIAWAADDPHAARHILDGAAHCGCH
jgi:hypothetical protein